MDSIFRVNKDDPEMIAAIKQARKSFPEFIEKADANLDLLIPVLEDAMVKLYITNPDEPDIGEHLWARYSGHDPEDEKRFTAIILNSPRGAADFLSKDDEVNFSIQILSDWLYVEDGKAFGAFTVQLLRSRMTGQRKKHDAAYPFTFD